MRRNSLFLVELLCNLVIFVLCAVVCVALLVRAHGISRESRQLTQWVAMAQNTAEQLRAGQSPEALTRKVEDMTVNCTTQGDEVVIHVTQDNKPGYTLTVVQQEVTLDG